jgi:hypothetical protein
MTERPKLKRDWAGRYVRLKHEHVTNGGVIFGPGEVMLVTRNYGGLHLKTTKKCGECSRRFRVSIKGVRDCDVELLPEDYQP